MKNILFVCKHNMFRSKIAEAYFNKINKNKNLKIKSAGIIKADALDKVQRKIVNLQTKTAKKFGINIKYDSKFLSIGLLKKQDMIIIVANDVPKYIFNDKFYLKPDLKVIVWKIPDVKGIKDVKGIITKDIKLIMKKVNQLVKSLEKSK